MIEDAVDELWTNSNSISKLLTTFHKGIVTLLQESRHFHANFQEGNLITEDQAENLTDEAQDRSLPRAGAIMHEHEISIVEIRKKLQIIQQHSLLRLAGLKTVISVLEAGLDGLVRKIQPRVDVGTQTGPVVNDEKTQDDIEEDRRESEEVAPVIDQFSLLGFTQSNLRMPGGWVE